MKIVYLLGKSAVGKDTVYERLKKNNKWNLETVVLYTTRPMRDGENEGEQYHFITEQQADELQKEGCVIEERTYQTIHGPWKYMTVNDGQFAWNKNYLMIGTLESYCKLREYFGEERMIPVYLEVDDGIRLERALARERMQKAPKYAEMCRRFLADDADFTQKKLEQAGIRMEERYNNIDLEECLKKIEWCLEQQFSDAINTK